MDVSRPAVMVVLLFVALLAWPSIVGAWYSYRRRRRKGRHRPENARI
jgi:hypothetical protein